MGFKEARIKAGLTALEASRKLNISPAAVYQWEDGSALPQTKRLPEIAGLYGCTVDDLLEVSNEH